VRATKGQLPQTGVLRQEERKRKKPPMLIGGAMK
jgi:hypothetical protein